MNELKTQSKEVFVLYYDYIIHTNDVNKGYQHQIPNINSTCFGKYILKQRETVLG